MYVLKYSLLFSLPNQTHLFFLPNQTHLFFLVFFVQKKPAEAPRPLYITPKSSIFDHSFMAGLQYNFFPTDFLYPRQQLDATNRAAAAAAAAGTVALPLQTTTCSAADLEQLKALVIENRGVQVVIKNSTIDGKSPTLPPPMNGG